MPPDLIMDTMHGMSERIVRADNAMVQFYSIAHFIIIITFILHHHRGWLEYNLRVKSDVQLDNLLLMAPA